MNSIPYCLRPSWQSLSGYVLDFAFAGSRNYANSFTHYSDKQKAWLKTTHPLSWQDAYPKEPLPELTRTQLVATRALFTGCVLFTVGFDLAWWAVCTVTIVPMWRLGFKNHLLNLVSTVSLFFFVWVIPFGSLPRVDHFRAFFPVGRMQEADMRKYGYQGGLSYVLYASEFCHNFEFVAERLDRFPNAGLELQEEQDQYGWRTPQDWVVPTAYAFSNGLNPNQQDEHGHTAWMEVAGLKVEKANLYVGHLLACADRVDPRLRKQVDLTIRDQNGFDALCYALMGVQIFRFPRMDENPAYLIEKNHISTTGKPINTQPLLELAEKLFMGGALLYERDFKSYRDFAMRVRNACFVNENHQDGNAPVDQILEKLNVIQAANQHHPNLYVRLACKVILPTFQRNCIREIEGPLHEISAKFLRNACALAQCQDELLAVWDAHHKRRAKALHPHLNAALPQVATDPLTIVAEYAPDVVGNS